LTTPSHSSTHFCNAAPCRPGHLGNLSYVAFPRALEEEPDDQNLQSRHANHHSHFNQAEIEDSTFCAPDCAKIPVLSCAEIFLHAADSAELAADFEDGIFERRGLLRGSAGFLGEESGAGLVFDLLQRRVRRPMQNWLWAEVEEKLAYSDLKIHHLV
jgi:hypothetical protein